MPIKKPRNPFYILLVPIGVAFVVTAFAYGVMAFQSVSTLRGGDASRNAHPLWSWLRRHGDETMLAELAALGVLTAAAIGTDRWWSRPGSPD
jgi:hypothetical protein